MEEILDPKKPWNISCSAWGIHLKRGPATHRPETGCLGSTERATRAEEPAPTASGVCGDCFCAFISSSTNKKDSVACSLYRDHSSGLKCGVESPGNVGATHVSWLRGHGSSSTGIEAFPVSACLRCPTCLVQVLKANRPKLFICDIAVVIQ